MLFGDMAKFALGSYLYGYTFLHYMEVRQMPDLQRGN